MGEGLPAPKTPCNRGCGQAVTSACHFHQDKELQNMLGAKGPWLAPHSAQSHRYPCSLGHNCYTHGPLMTFISCVSANITLLVEWQCCRGQETALAGKCLSLLQAAALLGSVSPTERCLLRQIKHQAGYQPMNRGHRLSAEKGKNFPSLSTWKLENFQAFWLKGGFKHLPSEETGRIKTLLEHLSFLLSNSLKSTGSTVLPLVSIGSSHRCQQKPSQEQNFLCWCSLPASHRKKNQGEIKRIIWRENNPEFTHGQSTKLCLYYLSP